jgi:hypothetical protein
VREHLVDSAGCPLDLRRSFAIDDPEGQMRAFFVTSGYLHIRSVFTPEEVAFYGTEVDRCRARMISGDGGLHADASSRLASVDIRGVTGTRCASEPRRDGE